MGQPNRNYYVFYIGWITTLSADVFLRTFFWQLRRRSRTSQLVLGIIVKKSSKQRIHEHKNVAQEETSLIYFNKIRYNRKNSDESILEPMLVLTIFSPLHNTFASNANEAFRPKNASAKYLEDRSCNVSMTCSCSIVFKLTKMWSVKRDRISENLACIWCGCSGAFVDSMIENTHPLKS